MGQTAGTKLRVNCMSSFPAPYLQLLESLSSCMLHFLEVVQGEANHVEVQFGYDDNGFYAASNAGGISLHTYQQMIKELKESEHPPSDETADSPTLRARYRIRDLLTADEPHWLTIARQAMASKTDTVNIDKFIKHLFTGQHLDTALDRETAADWQLPPNGKLHAELRILRAAWRIGTGTLYLGGAKRACWGCESVIIDLDEDAANGENFDVVRMSDIAAPGWAYPGVFYALAGVVRQDPQPGDLAKNARRRDSISLPK
jgi:hypothetical protein